MSIENSPQSSQERFATDGLTLEEDEKLVSLLGKWQGGPISTPVFTELARMIPQPIVEVVVFRMNSGTLETLLIPRPEDDIVWPGMYHNPGTALRLADFRRQDGNPLNGAFERIVRRELGTEFSYEPTFVCKLYGLGQRGAEVSETYYTEIPETSPVSDGFVWCPVQDLAVNPKFIQGQLEHITQAAQQYLASYNSQS